MPKFIGDFHIHSRYSRACSKDLNVPELAKWAKIKGIGVLGTGDFTHPLWLEELKSLLRDKGNGLYEYQETAFLLTAEVNTLFYKQAKAHQIHHLLFVPSLPVAERLNQELASFGGLSLDGRPMLRMTPAQLVSIVLGVDARCAVVPAHAWTPHFGLFGSNSGFDAIEECFEEQTKHIFALETGLSSDPAMNWRLKALDRYALISNSDAHSARRLGREANIFDCEISYDAILGALKMKDRSKFLSTVEFFPEEGKYHYDGHRNCRVCWAPAETKRRGLQCSVCGKKVTVGVMHRVDDLADRPEGFVPEGAIPFKSLVPLEEIIAEALGAGTGTKACDREYFKLITACGSEFAALLESPEALLRKTVAGPIAEGILNMRQGRVVVEPGYDGEFGKVKLSGEKESPVPEAEQQLTLF